MILTRAMSTEWHEHKFESVKTVEIFIVVIAYSKIPPENER